MKTSYYASKRLDPERHYLVRISIGAPQFFKHRVDAVVLDLAPTREILALADDNDPEVYKVAYLARLDSLGSARVKEIFAALTKAAGEREPVLLCFEKPEESSLFDDTYYCHRQLLARWFKEKSGTEISELR